MIDINKTGLIYILFGSLRKVIALLLTLVFSFLCIRGSITTNEFIPIFSTVLGYYFGKATALETPSNNTQNESGNIEKISSNIGNQIDKFDDDSRK